MGFKADLSFLAKLRMGATAARSVMDFLAQAGFSPIELERYSTSTKIWSTKVKRLRLADLLCIRTGLRVEVRGKSKLEIKMSDSPTNAERRWDTGARDDDLVALVPCRDLGDRVEVRGPPTFVRIGAMRVSQSTARLGPPKSASEGAERDLTWPSVVPSDDGTIITVEPGRVRVALRSGRRQWYSLTGRHCYVGEGDEVRAGASIIAGTVPNLADIRIYLSKSWTPIADLGSANATDRYAAGKALGCQPERRESRRALEAALKKETEPRTALEIAGAAARLGFEPGLVRLRNAVLAPEPSHPDYVSMEAVLILSELASKPAADVLAEIASKRNFENSELRQAAAWGLGKTGCKAYERLVPFLSDPDDDFSMHAIAAFGSDASKQVIKLLIDLLRTTDAERTRASAVAALRMIGSKGAGEQLIDALKGARDPWLLAALGSLPSAAQQGLRIPRAVAEAIEPLQLIGPDHNWLASTLAATNFNFLMQQA